MSRRRTRKLVEEKNSNSLSVFRRVAERGKKKEVFPFALSPPPLFTPSFLFPLPSASETERSTIRGGERVSERSRRRDERGRERGNEKENAICRLPSSILTAAATSSSLSRPLRGPSLLLLALSSAHREIRTRTTTCLRGEKKGEVPREGRERDRHVFFLETILLLFALAAFFFLAAPSSNLNSFSSLCSLSTSSHLKTAPSFWSPLLLLQRWDARRS